MIRTGRGRARTAVVIVGALSLLAAYQGASSGSSGPDSVTKALEIDRAQVEAINNINDVPAVTQSLAPGTLDARNLAVARYTAAGASAAAGSKPEYAVVWSGKNNIGDMSGNDWMRFVNQGSISPTGLENVGTKQWVGGLDAMVVVDVRKNNVDGSPNKDYGKVVNFVQVPPPFGVEGEPHHMQYEWEPGQPIVAGHLFTDLTTIWDVSDIPNITLKNVIRPEENPQGTLPDAYDFAGDRAIGTYMGGPDVPNYGGSPGSVVVFKPDSGKGMVQESETPSSAFGAVFSGNPGGIPEPPGQGWALDGIDLDVRPGETVALVGRTGAGKSTIVKLLARFYDPGSGRVTADGTDLRHLSLPGYRRRLGLVPQEAHLFSGSVRDNIAYGRPDATDAEIADAARAVGADEFIAGLPGGYDTPILERGRSLSSGQRQLLALARARLVDPAVLLLDEATSNLDLASEARVAAAMGTLSRGRTTIIVAHRLATAARADRIVVLAGGRVVEEGTHAALLAQGGVYAAMWAAGDPEADMPLAPEAGVPTSEAS